MRVTFLQLEKCLTWQLGVGPGPAADGLCSSHTQIVSNTCLFIVLWQFCRTLYSFFQDQISPPLWSLFCFFGYPLLENPLTQGSCLSCLCSKAKASIMLVFPMGWEGHLPQPLLFNIVLGVLAGELDKKWNKIQNFIHRWSCMVRKPKRLRFLVLQTIR